MIARVLPLTLALSAAALTAGPASAAPKKPPKAPPVQKVAFSITGMHADFVLQAQMPGDDEWSGNARATATTRLGPVKSTSRTITVDPRRPVPATTTVMSPLMTFPHQVVGSFVQTLDGEPSIDYQCGGTVDRQAPLAIRIRFVPASAATGPAAFVADWFNPYMGFSCPAVGRPNTGLAWPWPSVEDGQSDRYWPGPSFSVAQVLSGKELSIPLTIPAGERQYESPIGGGTATPSLLGHIKIRAKVTTVKKAGPKGPRGG